MATVFILDIPAPVQSSIIYKVPFKVKFTNIKVPGYSSSSPAPIGLAIIGINNYIL